MLYDVQKVIQIAQERKKKQDMPLDKKLVFSEFQFTLKQLSYILFPFQSLSFTNVKKFVRVKNFFLFEDIYY